MSTSAKMMMKTALTAATMTADAAVRTKVWTNNPKYNTEAECQKLDCDAGGVAKKCASCAEYATTHAATVKSYKTCDFTDADSGCKTPTADKYGYKGPAFSNFKMCEADDVANAAFSQCSSTNDVMYGHVRLSGFEHISISDSCAIGKWIGESERE